MCMSQLLQNTRAHTNIYSVSCIWTRDTVVIMTMAKIIKPLRPKFHELGKAVGWVKHTGHMLY